MSTFAERFLEAEEWVQRNTAGLRAWQELSGVSHAYVGGLKRRLKENPDASGRRDKLEALSRGLHEISGGRFAPLWLLTGEEDESMRVQHALYPSKDIVIAMAEKMGRYHEASLAGLRILSHKGEGAGEVVDPGEDYWWSELDRLEARARLQLRHDQDTFGSTEG